MLRPQFRGNATHYLPNGFCTDAHRVRPSFTSPACLLIYFPNDSCTDAHRVRPFFLTARRPHGPSALRTPHGLSALRTPHGLST